MTLNLTLAPLDDEISIHTFLAEGDAEARKRRALNGISIHTFLAEGDGAEGVHH